MSGIRDEVLLTARTPLFDVHQQSGPACSQRWVKLRVISERPRRNQDRWSFHEASLRGVTAEATHSEILRPIERGEFGP